MYFKPVGPTVDGNTTQNKMSKQTMGKSNIGNRRDPRNSVIILWVKETKQRAVLLEGIYCMGGI